MTIICSKKKIYFVLTRITTNGPRIITNKYYMRHSRVIIWKLYVQKKDIFCINTNYHELTINYSLIKIVRVMTKKDYMKPELQDMGILEESELLAYSVKSAGLGENDELSQDKDALTGDSWDEAMGRGSIWDEE